MRPLLACLLSMTLLATAGLDPAWAKVPVAPRHMALNLSVFPPLDLASQYDEAVIPTVALNLIGGQTYALEGFELGGLLNSEIAHMHGLQLTLGGNYVGGAVRGVQISTGLNFAGQDVVGVQLAMVLNRAGRGVTGAQLSGTANLALGPVQGVQVASLGNLILGTLDGMQVGALNVTIGKVRGVQLGLVNVADDIEGLPLGLFSYVRQGRLEAQLAMDSQGFARVEFNSGGKTLYSILALGYRLLPADGDLEIKGGCGWNLDLPLGYYHQVEVLGGAVVPTAASAGPVRGRATVRNGLGYRFAPHLAAKAGLSLNLWWPSSLPGNVDGSLGLVPGYYAALEF